VRVVKNANVLLVTFLRKKHCIITVSQKTACYKQNPQIATQKMPQAFFAHDLGNRQQATGNRQQATGNRQLYTSSK